MKRSGKEGRWADIPSARVRFAFEAVFLILVALGAALAQLRPLAIIALIGIAWLLVALIERASSRGWLPWRRARAKALTDPTAALAERPADETAALAGIPEEPEPQSPAPAVTRRPLDLPGLEEPEPAARSVVPPPPPPPVARPGPPPVFQPPPAAPPSQPAPPPAPRQWNLWDLERLAREQAGHDPRDEEWSALFVHLREFANADGMLPTAFDGLVRESFGELIRQPAGA